MLLPQLLEVMSGCSELDIHLRLRRKWLAIRKHRDGCSDRERLSLVLTWLNVRIKLRSFERARRLLLEHRN